MDFLWTLCSLTEFINRMKWCARQCLYFKHSVLQYGRMKDRLLHRPWAEDVYVNPHICSVTYFRIRKDKHRNLHTLLWLCRRLSEVVTILQKKQPPCPQLYIYSTADRVIPVKAVEAFIEQQRKTGRVVRACNLQSSPHVDHFRSHPQLYSDQLSNFLKEVTPNTNQEKLNWSSAGVLVRHI